MKLVLWVKGCSVVVLMVYCVGEKLINECDGIMYDYMVKQGVEYVEIVLLEGVSVDWVWDWLDLWNVVEFVENWKDVCVV